MAFLDTDVGQTEFTPPGLLSLTVIDKVTPGTYFCCFTFLLRWLFVILGLSGYFVFWNNIILISTYLFGT